MVIAGFTLVAQIAAPHERDRWYGLAATTRNAGLGIGGLLAGVLVGAHGIIGDHLVVLANGLSFFLAAGLLLLGVRVTAQQRSGSMQRPGYRLVLLASLTISWVEPHLPRQAVRTPELAHPTPAVTSSES